VIDNPVLQVNHPKWGDWRRKFSSTEKGVRNVGLVSENPFTQRPRQERVANVSIDAEEVDCSFGEQPGPKSCRPIGASSQANRAQNHCSAVTLAEGWLLGVLPHRVPARALVPTNEGVPTLHDDCAQPI
jgi:hypothetical protein